MRIEIFRHSPFRWNRAKTFLPVATGFAPLPNLLIQRVMQDPPPGYARFRHQHACPWA